MAVDEASFSTSMLSMSAGFRLLSGLLGTLPTAEVLPLYAGIPSITTSGAELRLMEFVPRIRMTGGLFSTPLGVVMFTPEARPCKAWSKLCTGDVAISLPLMEATLPVRSRRLWVP